MTIPGLGLPFGMWQYDGSTMYPNNQLGVLNDIAIYGNGCTADRLENLAAQLQVTIPALLQQQQAQIAAQWQAQLTNLSANNLNSLNNIFTPWQINNNPALNIPGLNNNSGRIAEGKILETLRKMGSGIYVADRINQEIVIKDKDGNEQTVTVLNRLLELVDGYRKDPENAELSKEDYEKIWDIASRYNQNGDISSDDFAALKKIALKTEAAKEEKTETEEEEEENDNGKDEDVDTSKHKERSDKYKEAIGKGLSNSPDGYKALARSFEEKLYHGDATEEDLNEITSQLDKFNVLNTVQEFKKEYGHMHGENIIDAIFGDTTRWGSGSGLFGEGDLLTDDAKPSVTKLTKLLIERTNDMIKKNPKMDATTKKSLQDKANSLKNLVDNVKSGWTSGAGWWSGQDISKSDKKAISSAFQDLADTLEKFENDTYGDPQDLY